MFLTGFAKKNISGTSLFIGMTDLHTHLLPGVDDGVPTEKEAFSVLSYMKNLGVEHVHLTPHIMYDLKDNYPARLQEKFEEFKNNCPVDIRLSLAGEYMLDQGFPDQLKTGLLTFEDKHVLIETSYMAPPPDFNQLLYDIIINGYQPILAHPERYMYMEQQEYNFLKEKGCKFQLNLFSLGGYYGKLPMLNAKSLLKQEMYDFIGSDTHHLSGYKRGLQNCNLTTKEIKKLNQLFTHNQSL